MVVRGAAVSVVHLGRGGGRHGRRRRAVAVLDDEVDRHLALETADVAVTEVVAQLVHLQMSTMRHARQTTHRVVQHAHCTTASPSYLNGMDGATQRLFLASFLRGRTTPLKKTDNSPPPKRLPNCVL